MTHPADPTERDPNYDWRTEVNWPHVRRLILLHGLYWLFGAAQVALFQVGMLTGATRTLVGVIDYLAWAVLAVLLFRIVAQARHIRGSVHLVSPRTFLILVGFITSLCAYVVLLSLIDMDTIYLF